MEPVFRLTYDIQNCDIDTTGNLKPSKLLYYAQEAAGQHCRLLAVDYDTLSKRNLFWAVIRHRVQITRLPREGETITVETWPMPTTRVAFPRATAAYDAQGQELFRVISLWVLMDSETRAMVLPGKSGIDVSGTLRGIELATPGSLPPRQLCNQLTRQVCINDLDRNGHMNNCRYLDWLTDLMPSELLQNHPIRELTLCYLSEAWEEEQLQLHWEMSDDGIFQMEAQRPEGPNSSGHSRVFAAQAQF